MRHYPTCFGGSMRLISWNLNARRSDVQAQVTALVAQVPDVVALQEVTPTTVAPLRTALREAGFTYATDSFALAPASFAPAGPRRYGLLTASRCEMIAEAPGRFHLPWPERVLSATLLTPGGRVEVHNTHVPPGSSNGWLKIAQLEGLYNGLARTALLPRVLCGDFNTPQVELPSGEIVTWAQRKSRDGTWRVVRTLQGGAGAAWDTGERLVVSRLADWDLADVYRRLHGYATQEASWILRRQGVSIGRRFDHVFASTALQPTWCGYLHALRERGLSDHSPIEVEFAWPRCAA